MKQAYTFSIADDRPRRFRLFARVLVIFALVVLIAVAVTANNSFMWIIAGAAVLVVFPSFGILNHLRIRLSFVPELISLAGLAVIFGILDYWFPATLMLLFFILVMLSTRPLHLIVESKMIKYTSVPEKSIDWSTLNNIVYKDGFITVDAKGDRLLQHKVSEAFLFSIGEEQEFNEFCQRRLLEINSLPGQNKQHVTI